MHSVDLYSIDFNVAWYPADESMAVEKTMERDTVFVVIQQ